MIFVDSREIRSSVPRLLTRFKIPTEMRTLPVCDYIIDNFGFERKEAGDYISSLISKHLNDQLYQMSFNFDRSYLIIEGNIEKTLISRNISPLVFYASLAGASFKTADDGKRGYIITVQTKNAFGTALFLKSMHERIARGESRMPSIQRVKPDSKARMEYVVSSLPRIGDKTAKKLLEVNKTLRQLFANDDWKMRGFGEKSNTAVQELLDKEYDE